MKRIGYGQVEPTHLSARRNGKIYGQLKAHIKDPDVSGDAATIAQLENGQFVKYDYVNNEVNFSGDGDWLLVYNEIKNYYQEERNSKDYCLKNSKAVDGEIYPRCLKTDINDIFITNGIGVANNDKNAEVTCGTFAVGDVLSPNASGFLEVSSTGSMKWKVVALTTLPDGQEALKLQRIA